jgi:hypothetical protein
LSLHLRGRRGSCPARCPSRWHPPPVGNCPVALPRAPPLCPFPGLSLRQGSEPPSVSASGCARADLLVRMGQRAAGLEASVGGGAASPEPSGRTALGPHSGRPPAARRTPAPLPGPTTALAGQASACMLYILADRCHPVHAASKLHAFTLRAALASAWRGPPMCMMYMDCGCGLKTMPGPGSARMGGGLLLTLGAPLATPRPAPYA